MGKPPAEICRDATGVIIAREGGQANKNAPAAAREGYGAFAEKPQAQTAWPALEVFKEVKEMR